MGKAFAIPEIFKNGIKDSVNKKLQMVDNMSEDVITNTKIIEPIIFPNLLGCFIFDIAVVMFKRKKIF